MIKVDFQQKIHLLHYILRFVHLISVHFVYFCNCVLIAAWIQAKLDFMPTKRNKINKPKNIE